MSSSVRDGEHGIPTPSQLAKVADAKDSGRNKSRPSGDDLFSKDRYETLQSKIREANLPNSPPDASTRRGLAAKVADIAEKARKADVFNKIIGGKGRKSRKHRGTRRRKTHRRRR
jgi:hypothetical protein